MDINCIYPCSYQKDGKCNLQYPISISFQNQNQNLNKIDCPYYVPTSCNQNNKTPSKVFY
ncbi:MAG: hypothetical protein GX347_05860 [Epulopiscium sp.]|nr:hypothetical protein [Candidatus Epulonipiscium sp.]